MSTETENTTTVETPVEPVVDTPVEKSMDDTLRETYARLTSTEETPAETPSATRSRGPDGKFAKAEAAQAQVVETPPVAAQASAYDAFPSSWKRDHEANWKALPPAIREEIHRREQNFLDGVKQYREPAAFGTAIGQELLPHVDSFRRLGTTPQAVVRDVMQTWSAFTNGNEGQKADALLQIARQYGIDIAALQQRATAPHAVEPDVAALAPLRQELAEIRGSIVAREQQQAQIEAETAERDIVAFKADAAHPHFETVRGEMSRLFATRQATTLQDAYDKAVWMVPAAREALLAEQDAARRKREADEATAARKAAAANVVRRGTPPATAKPGSMEDTIRETLRSIRSQ